MISYAMSVCAFGTEFNPESAEALRKSKFRNLELSLRSYIADNEKSRAAAAVTRELLADGTMQQLKCESRPVDPLFSIRQNERSVWFLENCDRLVPEMEAFRIPGGR